MPFDMSPQDVETVTKPDAAYTVETLAAWLETQDLKTTYDPRSPNDCLIMRWSAATGLKARDGNMDDYVKLGNAAFHKLSSPQTYERALIRARSLSAA